MKQNFEERLEKAKGLLDKLMSPDVTLEESVKLYKEGMDELKVAEKMLSEAKIEYEEIKKEIGNVQEPEL